MSVDSTTPGNTQADQEQLKAVEIEKNKFRSQIEGLDGQITLLDQQEQEIDVEAKAVEDKARQLTAEESELQKRKKIIQGEAQTVGEKRSRLQAERRKFAKEKEELNSKINQLNGKRERIAQHQAYAESQKEATIQQQPVGPLADPLGRRTHPRFSVSVDVSMHTEHNFFTGITENISGGGVFIATHDCIPVGTQVELTISLPGRPMIQATGEVRWAREYTPFTQDVSPGVGVRFSSLADGDRKAIEEFLQAREPLLYDVG